MRASRIGGEVLNPEREVPRVEAAWHTGAGAWSRTAVDPAEEHDGRPTVETGDRFIRHLARADHRSVEGISRAEELARMGGGEGGRQGGHGEREQQDREESDCGAEARGHEGEGSVAERLKGEG